MDEEYKFDWQLLTVGIGWMIAGLAAGLIGSVPFIGLFSAWIAPELFVGGLVCFLVAIFSYGKEGRIKVFLAMILVPIVAINSRWLLISDLFSSRYDGRFAASPIVVPVGGWVRLESNVDTVTARIRTVSGPIVKCPSTACFVITGYRSPGQNYVSGANPEYWVDRTSVAFMRSGISLSGDGKPAATVIVNQADYWNGTRIVNISATDSSDMEIGRVTERFRVGVPFESADGKSALMLEYLLHGNFLSNFFSGLFGQSSPYPVSRFVGRVFQSETRLTYEQITWKKVQIDGNEDARRLLPENPGMQNPRYSFRSGKSDCGDVATVFIPKNWEDIPNPEDPVVMYSRDASGRLNAYPRSRTRLHCHENRIYAVSETSGGNPTWRHIEVVVGGGGGVTECKVSIWMKTKSWSKSFVDPAGISLEDDSVTFDVVHLTPELHEVSRDRFSAPVTCNQTSV